MDTLQWSGSSGGTGVAVSDFPVLRLPPELLRMRTVKDIKVNAFVFEYRSHTYPPRLRWEHLSVHKTLFGSIL